MRKGEWDYDLCRDLGVDPGMLPDIYKCHDVVGKVTEKAAAECGLLAGTPVVAGALDAACGTLGAGVVRDGETQEQGGQAGGMSICMDEYKADKRLILSFHATSNQWILQGGTVGGGGVMRWLEKEFADYEIIGAYGAKPNIIPAFTEFNQWTTADDILSGKAFPGQKIVILGGGSVGCELADYLAPLLNDRFIRNRDITVLEMGKEILMTETGAGRSLLVQRMLQKGIHIECNAKMTKAQDGKI
jgi:sugar (pentulose or hexulose) kinase